MRSLYYPQEIRQIQEQNRAIPETTGTVIRLCKHTDRHFYQIEEIKVMTESDKKTSEKPKIESYLQSSHQIDRHC